MSNAPEGRAFLVSSSWHFSSCVLQLDNLSQETHLDILGSSQGVLLFNILAPSRISEGVRDDGGLFSFLMGAVKR